jgi:hypothetical protein
MIHAVAILALPYKAGGKRALVDHARGLELVQTQEFSHFFPMITLFLRSLNLR